MYPSRQQIEADFYYDWLYGDFHPLRENVANPRNNKDGYCVISVGGNPFLAHRCAWIMAFLEEPTAMLDHRDGRRDHNVIPNLRFANHSLNAQNRKKNSRNTSGYKGVSWERREGKWKAEIRKGKKRIYRKFFDDIEVAAQEIAIARNTLHGEFARHE